MIPLPDTMKAPPPSPPGEIERRADETAVDAAIAAAATRLHGLQFHPEHGYYGWSGDDAADGHATVAQVAREIAAEARAGLAGARRRHMFDGAFRPILARALDSLALHAARQRAGRHATAAGARVDAAIADSSAHHGDDARFAHAVFTAKAETDRLAAIHGWDQATTRAQRTALVAKAHAARLVGLAQASPERALAFFRAHRDKFPPVAQTQAEAKLSLLAKEERIQALARAIMAGSNVGGIACTGPDCADPAGHLAAWRAEATQVAAVVAQGDGDFRNELADAITARVERLRAEAAAKDRLGRNQLLAAALTHPRPCDPPELLERDPRLKLAWVDARPEVRAGIKARLRQNGRGSEPAPSPAALTQRRWAIGLRALHPAAFQRLDLTHAGFATLPADRRIELLRAQSEAAAAPDAARLLRLAQAAPVGRTP